MGKTWLVLRHELATAVSRPSFLLAALGLPLVASLLMWGVTALRGGSPSAADGSPQEAEEMELVVEGYVDYGGLIEAIPADVPAGKLVAYADEAAAQQALRSGDIAAYYVIPADYLASGDLLYVNPSYSPATNEGQAWIMQRAILSNLLGNDPERIARASRPMDVQERTIASQPEAETGQPLNFTVAYATTLFFTVVILAAASLLLNSVSMEKGSRVMETLLLSVTPRQLLAGKIVGLGIAGLLQMVVWVGTGFALVRVFGGSLRLPPDYELPFSILPWALAYFLLGYAIYASLMAGLGALVPNLKEASQATILVIWPLVLSLAVSVVNSETPHAPVVVGLSLFPLSAPVVMMTRLVAGGVPWWQPFVAAGLMLVAAILIVRAVAGMFRAQVLLSGQAFTVRRLFAALAGRQ